MPIDFGDDIVWYDDIDTSDTENIDAISDEEIHDFFRNNISEKYNDLDVNVIDMVSDFKKFYGSIFRNIVETKKENKKLISSYN